MSRFDHILDGKPRALKEYVLDQVADELAKDLRRFPPPIEEWLDESLQERYRPVLARVSLPEPETFRVACELARRELLRDYELIDRFCRSPEFPRLAPTDLEQQTVHFITRYLVDSALAFQEFAKGKFNRAELVTLVEKVEERLLHGHRLRL